MGNRVGKYKRKKTDTIIISAPNKPLESIVPQFQGVKVRALYNYVVQNSGDLPFIKGDVLIVNSDLKEPWWHAKHTVTLKTGYIPSNYVVIDDGSPTSLDSWFDINRAETDKKLLHPGYPQGTYIVRPSADKSIVKMGNCFKKPYQEQNNIMLGDNFDSIPRETTMQVASIQVIALYNYNVHNPGDLAFSRGDIMVISSDLSDPWWFATHQGNFQTGFIPSNYVAIDDGSPTSLEAWFDINRAETDRKLLLMGNPKGTYILRPSSDVRHCALSIRHFDVTKNFYVVKHYKIRQLDKGGYFISHRTPFPDIRSLITYYTQHSDGLCSRLADPFPRQHRPPIQFREIEVNRNCITMEKKLGNGSFGDVWLAKWNNSVEVAVKMVKQNSLDQTQRKCFLEEAKLMHQLHHPRIVEILGVCSEPPDAPVYIITELMSNGALLNFLRLDEGQKLNLKDMLLMMNQIADGMAYLESKNFVHRDLRAANILVAEDISVKVADFGLARVTESVYEADPGGKFPIKWTAPEAGLRRIFSVKSDVWSFGVLIYEIVTYGRSPYAGIQPRSVLEDIEKGYRLPNPHGGKVNCPAELYTMMLSCWDASPDKRPTFSHLKDVFEDYAIATERQYGVDE